MKRKSVFLVSKRVRINAVTCQSSSFSQLILVDLNISVKERATSTPDLLKMSRNCRFQLTNLQLRGHAMFSNAGLPLGSVSVEYAWLTELLIGDIKGLLSVTQVRLVIRKKLFPLFRVLLVKCEFQELIFTFFTNSCAARSSKIFLFSSNNLQEYPYITILLLLLLGFYVATKIMSSLLFQMQALLNWLEGFIFLSSNESNQLNKAYPDRKLPTGINWEQKKSVTV